MTAESTVAATQNENNFITRVPAEIREALGIRQGWKLIWSTMGHVAIVTARPLTLQEIEEIKNLKHKR